MQKVTERRNSAEKYFEIGHITKNKENKQFMWRKIKTSKKEKEERQLH